MARSPGREGEGARARRRVAADLGAGLLLASVLAVTTWWLLEPPASFLLHALALYGVLAVLVHRRAPARLPGPGMGAANRATLARAVLASPAVALAAHPGVLDDPARWWIVGLCTAAMVLDGVDGIVARRTGTESTFGARFDMETDAFLILGLSVLVWGSGQAGPWVVLIGALRYIFVGAARLWPPLRGELPPSRRRKTVCVVQGVVLLVCLGPVVPAAAASALAAGALALLLWSFAVDVRWLVRHAVPPEAPETVVSTGGGDPSRAATPP